MKKAIYIVALSIGVLTQASAQEKLDPMLVSELRTEELTNKVELTNQQIPAVQGVMLETINGLKEQFKASDQLIKSVAMALQAEQNSMREILTPAQFKIYAQDQAQKIELLEEIFGVKVKDEKGATQKTTIKR